MTSQALVMAIVGVVCLMPRPSTSHGRLWEPAGRTFAWKYNPALQQEYGLVPDTDDNGSNCGGRAPQKAAGGRCGVCGDNYVHPTPRPHEVGGKFVKAQERPIMGEYQPGQQATFTVQITAHHLGWFSFKLCPVNDFTVEATQECLDRHPVKLAASSKNYDPDGSGVFDQYKFKSPNRGDKIKVHVIIPSDLTCSPCTLQWRYHTGNDWGRDPITGEQGLGLGPQEEFYACSDVAIKGNGRPRPRAAPQRTPAPTAAPKPIFTTSNASPGGLTLTDCRAAGAYVITPGMDDWCRTNCVTHVGAKHCPESHCNDACRQLSASGLSVEP